MLQGHEGGGIEQIACARLQVELALQQPVEAIPGNAAPIAQDAEP